jgi:hypothetical protein
VEAAVENYYRTIAITPDESQRVKIAVEERLDALSETSIREIERCKELLANLKTQERKLLQKEYRDEVSPEMFSEESARLKRERLDATATATATAIVDRLSADHGTIQDALALMHTILGRDVHDLYLRATSTQRRVITQGIFAGLWISHEDVARSKLNEPFDAIQVITEAIEITKRASTSSEDPQTAKKGKAPNPKKGSGALAQGSIRTSMVELGGLEPPTSWVRSRRSPN